MKGMRRFGWLLACVLASVLCCGSAQATVHLCSADTKPFYSAQLPQQGPVVDFIRRAYQSQGLTVSVEFMSWAQAQKQALAGRCGLVGLWPSAERDQLFVYSKPLMTMRLGYFAPRAMPSLDAVLRQPQLTLGVQRGAYLNADVAKQFPNRLESADIAQALQQLAKGRVQLVFANREAGLYLLSQSPQLASQIRYLHDIERKDAVLAFARQQHDAPHLIFLFNQGMASLPSLPSF